MIISDKDLGKSLIASDKVAASGLEGDALIQARIAEEQALLDQELAAARARHDEALNALARKEEAAAERVEELESLLTNMESDQRLGNLPNLTRLIAEKTAALQALETKLSSLDQKTTPSASPPAAANPSMEKLGVEIIKQIDLIDAAQRGETDDKISLTTLRQSLSEMLSTLGIYEYRVVDWAEMNAELTPLVTVKEHRQGTGTRVVLQTLATGFQLETPHAAPRCLRPAEVITGCIDSLPS